MGETRVEYYGLHFLKEFCRHLLNNRPKNLKVYEETFRSVGIRRVNPPDSARKCLQSYATIKQQEIKCVLMGHKMRSTGTSIFGILQVTI